MSDLGKLGSQVVTFRTAQDSRSPLRTINRERLGPQATAVKTTQTEPGKIVTQASAIETHATTKDVLYLQGFVNIFKLVCLFACITCSGLAYSVKREDNGSMVTSEISYCLALSVIVFVTEATVFIYYCSHLTGKRGEKRRSNTLIKLILAYHLLAAGMIFVACVIMTGYLGDVARAFNAFSLLAYGGFSLEIYFDVVQLRKVGDLTAI